MNVIFLDIDGVLNCQSTFERYKGLYAIDQKLLKIFNSIFNHIEAKIVLSSCWRKSEESVKYLKEVVGLDIYDITPGSKSGIRGEEIKAWLDKHPKVENYIIIDDDSDMLPGQPLFQTSFKEGITDDHVHLIIDYFRFHSNPRRCLNCGRKMKRVKDPISGKGSIYLWKCKCMSRGSYLSIG